MSPHDIIIICFAYFHVYVRCGFIFWGRGTERESFFKMQKQIIGTASWAGRHTSCRQLFRDLHIFLVACLYILENYVT
jgi:hypothetical protein